MKMTFVIHFLFLMSLQVNASELKNVEVLETKNLESGMEVKLRDALINPKGYFYILISKKDPRWEMKTSLINSKKINKEKQPLQLEIKSFSATPEGSFYTSENVNFYGEVLKK